MGLVVNFLKNLCMDFWGTTLEMAPYLLLGFLFAGLLSIVISRTFIETHLGGRGMISILKATLMGVPMPLCSCSVIPVAMSLRRHGATKGSTISFLLSTPQTGAENIFVIFSLLGPVFAIFSPIATFITGIIGGFFVDTFAHGSNEPIPAHPDIEGCCTTGQNPSFLERLKKGFRYGFVTLPRDIGRAVLVGLFVAAIISALVPDNFFADNLGTGIFPMLVMMAVGIPLYVCATASVPVAAALILKGLTPGAAFVFLLTGPTTNSATIITIWKVLGKSVALIYVATVAACALVFGLLLDFIIKGAKIVVTEQMHVHAEGQLVLIIKYICAAILLSLLASGIFHKSTLHK